MKIRAMAVFGLGALVLLFAYWCISKLVFDECGLSEIHTRSIVQKELGGRGLNAKYLSTPENQGGSEDQKLNFIVMSTWFHGVELSWWNYKREKEELAGNTLRSASHSERQP